MANKNHKALPSASVDKWGCHIKSGTLVDEVSLTLRHSVILDDVAANFEDFDFQGNMECNLSLSSTQAATAFLPLQEENDPIITVFGRFSRWLCKVTWNVSPDFWRKWKYRYKPFSVLQGVRRQFHATWQGHIFLYVTWPLQYIYFFNVRLHVRSSPCKWLRLQWPFCSWYAFLSTRGSKAQGEKLKSWTFSGGQSFPKGWVSDGTYPPFPRERGRLWG